MLAETCRELIIGTWQVGKNGESLAGAPCHTFTPEGEYRMKTLSSGFTGDALSMITGSEERGRWRILKAADQTVLQLRILQKDHGLIDSLIKPITKLGAFALGYLLPPTELLISEIDNSIINLRIRQNAGREEVPVQLVRRHHVF